MSFCQFEGPPCLRHNNYVFYKAFKYKCEDGSKMLALGEFFFVKLLQEIPVCIGEIELLWEDKATNQFLTSLRLYFRPEHTPDGRQDDTGQDEVVALGERLVLRLDDLIPLIQHNIKWMYGCPTYCSGKSGYRNGDISHGHESGKKEWKNRETTAGSKDTRNGMVVKDEPGRKRSLSVNKMDSVVTKNAASGAANLAVMSYPKYCRYRAIQKRLEGCESEWVHLAVVVAIGGYSGRSPGCRVMFCRDTFYQPEIDDLDIRMDHMLPVLKGRPKGKKCRQLSRKDSQQDSDSMEEMFANVTPSISSSTRPRRLTESSDINEEKVSTEEQTFLIGLHKFMHDSKMPIGRIPSLGFKQIDLYYFYKQAEQLGGYDSITHKRMWKHLYDKLGGNSSNTSAATCTRKHYERLLLPYERHLRKLKVGKAKKKHPKQVVSEFDIKSEILHEKTTTLDVDKDVGITTKDEVKDVGITTKDEVKDVGVTAKDEVKDVGVTTKDEVKDVDVTTKDEIKYVGVTTKNEVKKELWPQDVKENVQVTASESSQISPKESTNCEEKLMPSVLEHSKELPAESEVLELPVVRRVVQSDGDLPSVDTVNKDESSNLLSFSQAEQKPLQAGKSSTSLTSNAFVLGENTALPYTNIVCKGGYLVPIFPHHMLQSSWGMMGPPSSTSSASSPHIRADGETSHLGVSFKDSITTLSASSKTNQDAPNQDVRSKSLTRKQLLSSHLPSSSDNDIHKASHTNTPHKSSPHVINDHIQPARKISHSSHHFSSIVAPGSSSQNLASMLHPTPPGHKCHIHLPPAPPAIYLHPSSISPFSSLQSPIVSSPPPAHCHPRKRVYPFDSPTAPSSGVLPSPTTPSSGLFPSPDMVLDRIRNSTSLPRSNAAQTNHLSTQQRFEDPRHIFRQTPQTVAAGHSVSSPQRKEYHFQQEVASSKLTNTKSKNSKKCNQAYTVYSHMSSPELQHALLNQGHAEHRPSNIAKNVDQIKPASNFNGMLSAHQTSRSGTSVPPASSVPSSSKGGRLTSALFGTQFTAVPRTSKSSELTPQQSLLADQTSAALSAISLNPHLHPAFMSPYLPAGSTAAPQFQMLAGAFASPAQLAAYEELLRQNGYGAFLTASSPGKLSKKN